MARHYLYEAANVLLTTVRRPSALKSWGLKLMKAARAEAYQSSETDVVAAIEDINRFRRMRSVGAYLGLTSRLGKDLER